VESYRLNGSLLHWWISWNALSHVIATNNVFLIHIVYGSNNVYRVRAIEAPRGSQRDNSPLPSRHVGSKTPFFPSRRRIPGAEITIACFMNVPLRYLLHRRAIPAACRCRLLHARQDRIANVKQADCPSPARVYISPPPFTFPPSPPSHPSAPPPLFLFFDKRRAMQRGLHRSSRAATDRGCTR